MPNFPRVGMRMVKTALAVGICFLLYILRGEHGAPVFSAIAAIICMQPYVENSVQVAFNRVVGTLLGAAFALLALYFIRFIPEDYHLWKYAVISFAVIPVLYITVLFKKTGASSLASIVFLSVCLSNSGDIPLMDAANRSVETIIGILVSLAVNIVHLPRRREKDYFFISGFDGALYHEEEGMTPYCTFEMNQLLHEGLPFTIATERTPASLLADLGKLNLNLPVIAMDGAVLYDVKEKRYLACNGLERDMVNKICGFLQKKGYHYFLNVVWQDVLLIYYRDFKNDVEKELYENARRSPYRNYVYGDVPEEGIVVYILLVLRDEEADFLEAEIRGADMRQELLFLRDKSETPEDYCHLKIYHKTATKEEMVRRMLRDMPQKKCVVFGSNKNDLSMMAAAELSYAVPNAMPEAKTLADYTLKGGTDSVARQMLRLYMPLPWQKPPKELR